MRYGSLALVILWVVALTASFAQSAAPTQGAKPIGRITAAYGIAAIDDTSGGDRSADLHAMLSSGERIRTNGGGVSVLLASRVVLKIDSATAVRITENVGETSIQIEYGTVHVFCGKRPATSGAVVVHDLNGRIEVPGSAVILVSHDPETHETYYACEEASIALEPLKGDDILTLPADNQAVLVDGQTKAVGEIDRLAFTMKKKSFDRLGQSTIQKNTETFRLRSRTADLNMAMSQLAAAGWIDPRTLPRAQRATPAQAKKPETQSNEKNSESEAEATTEGAQEADSAAAPRKAEGTLTAPPSPDEERAAAANSPDAQVEMPTDASTEAVDRTPAAAVDIGTPAPPLADTGDLAAPAAAEGAPPVADFEVPGKNDVGVADTPMDVPAANDIAPQVLDIPAGDMDVAAPPAADIASPELDIAIDVPDVVIPDMDLAPPVADIGADIDVAPPAAEIGTIEVPSEIAAPEVDVPVEIPTEVPDIEPPAVVDLGGDLGAPEPAADIAPPVDIEVPDAVEAAPPADIDIGVPEIDIAPPEVVEIPMDVISEPVAPDPEVAPPAVDIDMPVLDVPEVEAPAIETPSDLAPPPADIEVPVPEAPELDIEPPEEVSMPDLGDDPGGLPPPVDLDVGESVDAGEIAPPAVEEPIAAPDDIVLPEPDTEVAIPDDVKEVITETETDRGGKGKGKRD